MTPDRHRFNPYEWLIVAVIIGVIVMFGLRYYGAMAERAAATTMQLSARSFDFAVKVVHVYGQLLPSGERQVLLTEGYLARLDENLPARQEGHPPVAVWVNEAGWPVDAGVEQPAQGLNQEACQRLWQILLKVEKSAKVGHAYWQGLEVSQPAAGLCRYSLQRPEGQRYSIEYNSHNGQTVFLSD